MLADKRTKDMQQAKDDVKDFETRLGKIDTWIADLDKKVKAASDTKTDEYKGWVASKVRKDELKKLGDAIKGAAAKYEAKVKKELDTRATVEAAAKKKADYALV